MKRIIVHHSLTEDSRTVSWGAIRDWHTGKNPESPYRWRDIGYHFGIERINENYEIMVGRMIQEIGAHTKGYNRDSVGICVVGNFDLVSPDAAQYSLSARLISSICDLFDIPHSQVFGHRDFANKSCPGNKFDMDFLRSLLR